MGLEYLGYLCLKLAIFGMYNKCYLSLIVQCCVKIELLAVTSVALPFLCYANSVPWDSDRHRKRAIVGEWNITS